MCQQLKYDVSNGRFHSEVDWESRYRELEDQLAEMVLFLSTQRSGNNVVDELHGSSKGHVKIESVERSPEGGSIRLVVVSTGSDLEYALYEYSGDQRTSSWNYRRSNTFDIDVSGGRVDRVRIFVRTRSQPELMDTRSLDLKGMK